MPEFKMEIVAFLGQSRALFMLLLETKVSSSTVGCLTMYCRYNHISPSTVLVTLPFFFVFFFTKCHLFNLTCVLILFFFVYFFFVCFVCYCTSCTSFYLYLTARLPLDFVLIRFGENISFGKRERCWGSKARTQVMDEQWYGELKICINMWCLPSDAREQRNWEEFVEKRTEMYIMS